MLNSKGVLVRKRRELRLAELNLSYLLGTYPENIQRQSLSEVNEYQTLRDEITMKTDEVLLQRRSVDNANTMVKVGYADYLDMLNSQSNSLASEIDYIELKIQQLQSIVTLHRALGGGWQ